MRRRRAVVVPAVLGLLPLLAAAACGDEPARHFPGAFPGTHTDVSAEQAFRDFDLHLPRSAHVVGYYAWSEDDTYPMAAVLRMPCTAVEDFAAGSGMRPASPGEPGTTAVEVFAEGRGWTGGDTDPRWLRDSDHAGAVAQGTGPRCTVYLHT
ncbi:hypothetical protein [Streptomyces sp. enrichment culture]|uniref:hypothetical protein n=1 Tax=Streptomyces sp. enrichment culture TaxID=1795815 RepID=UPI003F56E8A9